MNESTTEKTIFEKRAALLEETAKFFNSSNRSTGGGFTCLYYAEGKEGCAIGRKIPDKELCKEMDATAEIGSINHIKKDHPDLYERIPEELRELGVEFLDALQFLHDFEENWTSTGLSKKGQEVYDKIRYNFCWEHKLC